MGMCSPPVLHVSCNYHSCIFRSVPVGIDGISRTGMQTGTRQTPIPPRAKFRPVSAVSACFGPYV